MSVTFTKLFSSITESTVWCEPDHVRILWITMLAMSDRNGRVWGSIPGLANRARIPVESARDAIARFLAPDSDSRTPDNEGRRIEPIDGGWRLLNHEKYRAIRDEESIKESKRKYINARRAEERKAPNVENVERGRHNAEADTEADTKADTEADTEADTKKVKNNTRSASACIRPENVPEQVWDDFMAIRKAKKSPLTASGLRGIEREASKAQLSLGDALAMCCARGWQGFNAEWVAGPAAKGKLNMADEMEAFKKMVLDNSEKDITHE
jgi:hypothetical protein